MMPPHHTNRAAAAGVAGWSPGRRAAPLKIADCHLLVALLKVTLCKTRPLSTATENINFIHTDFFTAHFARTFIPVHSFPDISRNGSGCICIAFQGLFCCPLKFKLNLCQLEIMLKHWLEVRGGVG